MVSVNLKQLNAFRALMVAGSTAEAASLLNISQPAVSRSIHNLEELVDYRLFTRRNGRLFPTEEAEALYRELQQFFDSVDHISTVLENIRPHGDGHIRIIASTPMAQRFLPDAIAAFRESRPNVQISVRIVVKRETSRILNAQQFDVALLTLPVEYADSHVERLTSVEGVCILPKGHRLCARTVVEASDLQDEHFISIVPDTMLRARVDGAFNSQNVTRRKMLLETQSGASICQMVAAGLGVSVVDSLTASAFTPHAIEVRPFRPTVRFDYGLARPINRSQSRIVKEFEDMLHAQARRLRLARESASDDAAAARAAAGPPRTP